MTNYVKEIKDSFLSIYDRIDPTNSRLYIPTEILEEILSNELVGLSLEGLPLRTRSKIVKEKICVALGYPIPKAFKKTHPKFIGQNFDVFTQKSLNVQIWNEDIDSNRRYVLIRENKDGIITRVRVITGVQLAYYNHTGTLTQKYQARMPFGRASFCSDRDTNAVEDWICHDCTLSLAGISPNQMPARHQLLPIKELFNHLIPLVGQTIDYVNAIQERNRGAELHEKICHLLGYSYFSDNGTYPDIANQMLEIKLQTSPTIDLGLHSPIDGEIIFTINDKHFYSHDIRYAVINGQTMGKKIIIQNIYIVTGEDFPKYFPIFQGKGINTKIQIPLPLDFFD